MKLIYDPSIPDVVTFDIPLTPALAYDVETVHAASICDMKMTQAMAAAISSCLRPGRVEATMMENTSQKNVPASETPSKYTKAQSVAPAPTLTKIVKKTKTKTKTKKKENDTEPKDKRAPNAWNRHFKAECERLRNEDSSIPRTEYMAIAAKTWKMKNA
jgi:hypothetical protein